ncbi:MAG: DUF6600 domain-containing protein [Thiohalocapsa sp.]
MLGAILPAVAEDRPLPGVGRVAAVEGGLALRQGGQGGGEWSDSAVNEPVAAGMALRTPARGRAALRIGAETIALSGGSEAELTQLDEGGTQLVLHRGRLGVRVSTLAPARSIEIDVPRGGVWLLTPGDYDIVAGDKDTPTRIVVHDGRARFVGSGLDTAIAAGSADVLRPGESSVSREDAVADDFTAWWRAASGPDEPEALHHVSAEMTGYEALDGQGSWRNVAGYGAVWFPKASAEEWAPYRNGHWRWIQPWGWTWIDDMPWAFAPTHYGRWARIGEADGLAPFEKPPERWGWVPGKPGVAPVFAPALVAFLGTPGIGLSYPDAVGPAVAWFPLAPGEAYWPAYSSDPEMVRRINAASAPDAAAAGDTVDGRSSAVPGAIVNADYANRRFARAVPRTVFTGGRAVAPALLQLPGRRLDNAPLLAGSPQIAPSPAAAADAATRTAAARATPHLRSAVLRKVAARKAVLRKVVARKVVQARSRILRYHGPHRRGRVAGLRHAAAARHTHPSRHRIATATGKHARGHVRLAGR